LVLSITKTVLPKLALRERKIKHIPKSNCIALKLKASVIMIWDLD